MTEDNPFETQQSPVSVGIAECAVTTAGETLRTVGLGSCVAVSLVDTDRGVAGLLHALLPVADAYDATEACRFVDTGIEYLISEIEQRGGTQRHLEAKLAGGAEQFGQSNDPIGPQNRSQAERVLTRYEIPIAAADTGGQQSRSVHLDGETGELIVKTEQQERIL